MAISVAGRVAQGLPEYLPLDHRHEIAREKRGRADFAQGDSRATGKWRRWIDLSHRGRGRAARACTGVRRNGSCDEQRSAALRIIWEAQCICGIAAALLP